jgi:hypothetical protein
MTLRRDHLTAWSWLSAPRHHLHGHHLNIALHVLDVALLLSLWT